MKIAEVISSLESWAHTSLQESYDNAGLLTGNPDWECTGIICSVDATEEVVNEAIAKGFNLVVAHHPIIFRGLKKINGKNYVERTVILAIKKDIAIYAIHTNLDNILEGVSGNMARLLGMKGYGVLQGRDASLKKLYTYAPAASADQVRQALFAAGGGQIGEYSECSFNMEGMGTFKPGDGAQPFIGEPGKLQEEKEIKIELVFPAHLESALLKALKAGHPYEEVAFEVISLSNLHPEFGSGVIGELPEPMDEKVFLQRLKAVFGLKMIRHTALLNRPLKKVALCGGAGSFLISKALSAGADAFVTADLKYHEFFDADGRMLLVDIGHFESEQFTINQLQEFLLDKFRNFAVLKTGVETNPVRYL